MIDRVNKGDTRLEEAQTNVQNGIHQSYVQRRNSKKVFFFTASYILLSHRAEELLTFSYGIELKASSGSSPRKGQTSWVN